MKLTSIAFEEGKAIPKTYTCEGKDVSPPLGWTQPPQGTESFALICDDPDAPMGTWVHWVLYNIPKDTQRLPEGLPVQAHLPDGARQGRTDFGGVGYGGPCPPSGTHRYFFKLYALDCLIEPSDKATKHDVTRAMEGHVLAQASLMGTYKRVS